jgi:hypothetical protein
MGRRTALRLPLMSKGACLGRVVVVRHVMFLALALSLASCESSSSSGGASPASSAGHADAASATPAVTEETKAILARLAPSYRGTMGARPVVMRVYHDATRATATYFDEASGETRMLSGAVAGTRLAMDETNGAAKSGTLSLDVSGTGALSGSRTDASGATADVKLEPVVEALHPDHALLFKRTKKDSKPATGGAPAGQACNVNVEYAEIYGLPKAAEAKVNADLAPTSALAMPDKCDHAVDIGSTYRVAHNGDGLLSVRTTDTVVDAHADKPPSRGRAVTVMLATGERVKLFGDIVKPKSERAFEATLLHQAQAVAAKNHVDDAGKKLLEEALGFSPPFVVEDKGVRIFPDSLPPAYAAVSAEGVFVPFTMIPRPEGAFAVLWGK